MEVNLTTLSNEVTEKIHTILRPFEYTRIDKIVDVVFTTAEDKENEIDELEIKKFEDVTEVKLYESDNRFDFEYIKC
jgi:hypothetical protein